MAVLLDNPIRSYQWGSSTALAGFLGRSPSGEPEAELWIGAHPDSPSIVVGDGRPLDRYIADDPSGTLGPAVVKRFGDRLPFLLKVLAVERPLSIQAHPTIAQAVAGYAREDSAGIALSSRRRSYRDRSHKPEMVVALTSCEALLGFADPAETAELLESCEHPELAGAGQVLRGERGLREVVSRWLRLPDGAAGDVLGALAHEATGRTEPSFALIDRLGRVHPHDRGLLLAMLMRHIRLKPGEAAFVPAGMPHAYLSGMVVEAQANSDNTIRAGLTSKHVDTEEALRLLRCEPDIPVRVDVTSIGFQRRLYSPPSDIEEFRLCWLTLATEDVEASGPRLILVTDGQAQVHSGASSTTLRQGQAAFVPAAEADAAIRGHGSAFMLTCALDAAR